MNRAGFLKRLAGLLVAPAVIPEMKPDCASAEKPKPKPDDMVYIKVPMWTSVPQGNTVRVVVDGIVHDIPVA